MRLDFESVMNQVLKLVFLGAQLSGFSRGQDEIRVVGLGMIALTDHSINDLDDIGLPLLMVVKCP